MKTMNTLIPAILLSASATLAFAQSAPTAPSLAAAEAKNHVGEATTVCGKVVDTQTLKYGIAGRGKPVTFDLDQPEPSPVFYFLTFGSHEGGPEEAIAAYQGKRVCVNGKILVRGTTPFIMAADRAQIKVQEEAKPVETKKEETK